jgi:hypothetical protein
VTTTDPINLPFRWDFLAIENPADKAIRWKWRAYTHAGKLTMESQDTFETRTECVVDATAHGYRGN